MPPTVATQTDSVTRCAYGTSSVTSAIQPAGSGSAARSTDGAGGIGVTIGVAFNDCAKATSWSRVIAERYDLNLWIADLFEGATYLPR